LKTGGGARGGNFTRASPEALFFQFLKLNLAPENVIFFKFSQVFGQNSPEISNIDFLYTTNRTCKTRAGPSETPPLPPLTTSEIFKITTETLKFWGFWRLLEKNPRNYEGDYRISDFSVKPPLKFWKSINL